MTQHEQNNGAVPTMDLAQAEQVIAAISAVNMDEVTDDEMVVPIREWKVIEEQGRKRRKAEVREARISTFVPMRLFNQMIKSQQVRTTANSGQDAGASIRWMTEQVLAVWKLSEEDMTLEKLEEGLRGEKIIQLFFAFFGGMLRAVPNIKAVTAGASMPGNTQA